jgi:hypothetical protein
MVDIMNRVLMDTEEFQHGTSFVVCQAPQRATSQYLTMLWWEVKSDNQTISRVIISQTPAKHWTPDVFIDPAWMNGNGSVSCQVSLSQFISNTHHLQNYVRLEKQTMTSLYFIWKSITYAHKHTHLFMCTSHKQKCQLGIISTPDKTKNAT